MQYVSVIHDGDARWGLLQERTIHLAPMASDWPRSLLDALRDPDGNGPGRVLDEARETVSLDEVTLQAPIPRPPRNVICLGLNYAEHARESQQAKGQEPELPEHPVVFTKATSSVTGPDADIPLDPRVTTQLDWEVELAVIIGTGGRHIPEDRAHAHVFGYTVINDLSARDLQFRHKQFFLGKSLDGCCPMGPGIVPADRIADPHGLRLWCNVNGERQQYGHTSDQIFRIPDTIARLSAVMTLEPGDVIATGTPSGVGFAQQPPRFLQAGDRVECGIEDIGILRNRIVPA